MDKIKVAAVQMRLDFKKDKQEFLDKIEPFVREAKKNKCLLVAFPEDCGTLLLGAYKKPFTLLKEYFTPEQSLRDFFTRLFKLPLAAKVFAIASPNALSIYLEVFSLLAKKYGIYIMAGSILECENNKVYNSAYFFSPAGKIMGKQKKIHLYPTEIAWGITPGNEINIFSTEFGKVGMMVCMDNNYSELARILRFKGADLVMDCACNPDYYYHNASLMGLWAQVQQNYFYGMQSCMVGDVFGKIIIRGKSKIFAPCYLTKDISGIIKQAKNDNAEELVIAELNFRALKKFREKFDVIEIINSDLLKENINLYDEIPRKKRSTNILSILRGLTLNKK